MISPVLYGLDSSGKVRVWYYEVQGDKYRTTSGLLEGKTITSAWTQAFETNAGKANSRSPEAQAVEEANAKYEKKLKTGYFERLEDVKVWEHLPMLARNYKDLSELDFRRGLWLGQCKYNGHRCIATKDGLWTRKKERIVSVPHIEAALSPFFVKHPEAMLDGELFNEDLRQQLNRLSSLCRKTAPTPEDLAESEAIVRYYPYDGYGFCKTTRQTGYSARKRLIDQLEGKIPYVKTVDSVVILSEEHFDAYYEELLQEGHEGAVLRRTHGTYQNDKRTADLLKRKPDDEEEFRIVKVEEGSGNWAGFAKIIWLSDDGGKEFKASFKGTQEQAAEVLQNKEDWEGRVVSIKFNGRTGLGTPNFAQLDYNNCCKE